jgi:hypothetical protein
VQVDHRYDVAPGDLFDVLVDPGFLRARSERYGGIGTPSIVRRGADVEVRTARQLPLEHVPGAFRRFVGDGRVEQVDTWLGVGTGEGSDIAGRWVLETGRAPIDLGGRHMITADAGGCTYVVVADITVRVPVVAKRLSREVEQYLAQLITAEQTFLADWIKQNAMRRADG